MEFCSIRQRHSLCLLLEALVPTGITSTVPRYVNEVVSDVRGINEPGWYAMDDVGNASTGPFFSHAEYLGSITQPTYEA